MYTRTKNAFLQYTFAILCIPISCSPVPVTRQATYFLLILSRVPIRFHPFNPPPPSRKLLTASFASAEKHPVAGLIKADYTETMDGPVDGGKSTDKFRLIRIWHIAPRGACAHARPKLTIREMRILLTTVFACRLL